MYATLKMPKVDDEADKVVVAPVKVMPGDHVLEGRYWMQVEKDKASVEMPSPLAGTIAAVHVGESDEVSTGALTFAIEG